MDSVSQIALGAALGELVLGRHIGRRAAVFGAVLGTLPDLDVLVPYADAVDTFTRHRSWSHSVFVLTAASLPLAWLARRLVKMSASPPGFGRWWFAAWLVLVTHPLLDAFTLYGTQLFWPLPLRPVAIGSVFVIDPLVTVPLLIGLIWLWRRRTPAARLANGAGLALATSYLGVTLVVQAQVTEIARASLVERGHDAERLVVAPLPMSLLWRVVALDGDTYREGWRSLLDDAPAMRFTERDRGTGLLAAVGDDPSVQRLRWFTDGFVRARASDETLVLTDLRMGAEANYVFSFEVGERDAAGDWRSVVPRDRAPEFDTDALSEVLRRVVDEDAFGDGAGMKPVR